MKITLYPWDVQEAVEKYIVQQLGADTERFNASEMHFEYQTYTHDKETNTSTRSEPQSFEFGDCCELTVYIEEVTNP